MITKALRLASLSALFGAAGVTAAQVNLFLLLCVKRAQSLVRFAADGHAPFT
jgi:hypothetical protein